MAHVPETRPNLALSFAAPRLCCAVENRGDDQPSCNLTQHDRCLDTRLPHDGRRTPRGKLKASQLKPGSLEVWHGSPGE